MARRELTYYARLFLTDPNALKRTVLVPMLVWEAPPQKQDDDFLLGTLSGVGKSRPTSKDPLVFELLKGASKQNAFGFGITVGRTENNDLVVEDNSVSRFHAYFQQAKGAWTLVDADSRNGTWVDGIKLAGKKPHALKLGARLRFGDVEMRIHSPETFEEFIKLKMGQ